MKVSVNKEVIEEILSRSIDSIYPSKDSLRELLFSGRQITIYNGIDPTADYVHLGHSTNYLILERLHKLGHKIIVLVGDFTAMIGDPSDKTSARIQLTRDDVLRNLQSFKDQIGKILDFDNKENLIEFRFNSEWLSKLNFEQLIDLASNFTVQQMLERDMFEQRISKNKPLFVHEFFYPLMQGYDSVALGVDAEIGGTDQTFNMLSGRTLAKRYLDKEKFVITTTLLVNPATGEKLMSKSLGTGIGLNESAENMFGKVMALADEGIIQTFIDCTRLPLEEIDKKKARLAAGENPRDLKMELALEIASMYHGQAEAEKAKNNFINTFSNKNLPTEIEEFQPSQHDLLSILVEAKLVSSKGEARRVIDQGGVKIDGETVKDPALEIKTGSILQKGKLKFIKVI